MPIAEWGLTILGEDECRKLLGEAAVGRVGLSVHALPIILPVNYVVVGGRITFWSAPGLKLAAARAETVVAFEVDSFDREEESGWSVLLTGMAREVTDPEVIEAAVAAGLHPWPKGDRFHLIQVEDEFISGRRISAQHDAHRA